MNYITTTKEEQELMLEVIGVESLEELFADIPEAIRYRGTLDLPPAMTEAQLRRHAEALAERNADFGHYACFLGGGAYDHLVPSAVKHVTQRSEFITAYTAYQAEASQGVLQAIYEYQTMMAELTGMDVANASMYDGATALAEGALMACRATGRSKVVVPDSVHPEYRQVTHTYLRHQDIEMIVVPHSEGTADANRLQDAVDADTAAVLLQHPNFFGNLEPVHEAADLAHAVGALCVAAVDPISLGVLEPPGDWGADIVVGEGQSLGVPLSFGGPGLGFLTARENLVRRLPGRIVGSTVDTNGRTGYVLTLQTREQHIRRERATSNICSDATLTAIAGAVYLCMLGKVGIRKVAERCLQYAHYTADRMTALSAFEPAWNAPFFKEFVVRTTADPRELTRGLLDQRIIGGLPLGSHYQELQDGLLFCVTEARNREEMDGLIDALDSLT